MYSAPKQSWKWRLLLRLILCFSVYKFSISFFFLITRIKIGNKRIRWESSQADRMVKCLQANRYLRMETPALKHPQLQRTENHCYASYRSFCNFSFFSIPLMPGDRPHSDQTFSLSWKQVEKGPLFPFHGKHTDCMQTESLFQSGRLKI